MRIVAFMIAVSVFVALFALAILLAVRFLTVQRALRTAVLEAEERFRLLTENIPELVWIGTPEGKFEFCNRRWYEATGLTQQQMSTQNWTDVLHPDDRFELAQAWKSMVNTGKSLESEYRLREANGVFRWYRVRLSPVRDERGMILKWFGACTDIQKQIDTRNELEQQIKQHTSQLMEANLRLEDEMQERALAQQELNQQSDRMVKELTRRSQRATSLAKMGELLHSCASLQDVFSVVSGVAPKIFPELRGALLLFESSRRFLEVVAEWSGCQLANSSFEPSDCWAVRTGHMHLVDAGDRTAQCQHVMPADEGGYFCVPISAEAQTIGLLHFQFIQDTSLGEAGFSVASAFAEQIGLSIANIRLRDLLRTQSTHDALTGLFNRRYLEEALHREIRRASRSRQLLGVMMLDLDHFKHLNDTYGHEVGDAVLKEVAVCLLGGIRNEDIACRYGGEEFVIILPTANYDTTLERAEALRKKVHGISVQHHGRSVGVITVSIGVAEFPAHGSSVKELLASADTSLYEAKNQGRDRVIGSKLPEKAYEI